MKETKVEIDAGFDVARLALETGAPEIIRINDGHPTRTQGDVSFLTLSETTGAPIERHYSPAVELGEK